jgi:16S rRNA (uracil1498-N3)-methyltransferase
LRRFILASGFTAGTPFALTGKDFHYLARVLRKKEGDSIPIELPNGQIGEMKILARQKDQIHCKIISVEEKNANIQSNNSPNIVLFQALPKGAKMDLIVRQACEAGISSIVPILTEFSVPKHTTTGNDASHKYERWIRISREARQQSGSLVESKILPIQDVQSALTWWKLQQNNTTSSLGLFFHQSPLENASLHRYLFDTPELIALAVGPEGGFSQYEAEMFSEHGFQAVLLGNNILRTETAALYAIAAVQQIITERSEWTLTKEN